MQSNSIMMIRAKFAKKYDERCHIFYNFDRDETNRSDIERAVWKRENKRNRDSTTYNLYLLRFTEMQTEMQSAFKMFTLQGCGSMT